MKMNYEEIGLKCGIELHQQLEGRKLFCNCPTLLRDERPDFTVRRRLRAVAGEGGEVDVAAKQEQLKGKGFVYQGYVDSTCLVELDEEPPHELNKSALYTCLQFCKLIGARVSPVVQVMRKIVVDGSNTSGFQRTALIARGGEIDTSLGKVEIENISLEEDAAKIVSENEGEKVYRLDRLGIPLIEIGTAPEIKSPEQCFEAAKRLGMLLRSLPGVKRGLGTIRQDVNISIKGGSRIEVKGAQDLRMLPVLVELEVKRQLELLKIKKELKGLKLGKPDIIDVTASFKGCKSKVVKGDKEGNKEGNKGGNKVFGLRLKGFAGLMGRELQPGYRVGSELAGRAKVKAGVGGIFHSDELPGYGITEKEVEKVGKELKGGKKDGFVLVAGTEEKARRALEAVYERAEEFLTGVPKEVRKAEADGKTSFMRPMPGAARMYPETDVPLVYPDLEEVEVPETVEERVKRYQQSYGLGRDLAEFLIRSGKGFLFEEIVRKNPALKAAFVAETMTSTLLEIRRKYALEPEKLTDENFKELFYYLSCGKIHKDIVLDVLIDMIKGKFDIKSYESLARETVHYQVEEIVKQNKGAPFGALMGLCMKKLGGKASGKVIAEVLKEVLG